MRTRVALFENHGQAEPTRQRLSQAGIHAEIHNESRLAKLWFVPKNRGGVRLEVSARDAERARQLLAQWEAENGWVKSAIRCPECKSTRIEYPQFTEKSLLTNLAMGLMAECRLVERAYYCEDCHCMWSKSDAGPRRRRPHTAPNYFLEVLQPEPAACGSVARTKPIGSQTRSGLKVPSWRKCPAPPARSRFQIFRLWRRLLGVTALLGGIWLLPGSPSGILAPSMAAAEDKAFAPPTARILARKVAIAPASTAAANPESPTYLRDVLPILMGKCARCHSDQSQFMLNWLDYRTASADRWEIKRRVWDSWKGHYFKQPMPTVNSPESEAITDDERNIIRHWVESGALCGVRPTAQSAQSKPERIEQGKRLFATICSTCHQPTGQGIPGRFPPLAGSDFLNSDKHRAIGVVVHGLQGEVTVNGRKFNNSMPRFPLSDDDIANALTYVYNAFGNSGQEVLPQEVSATRAEQENLNLVGQSQSARPAEEKSPFE